MSEGDGKSRGIMGDHYGGGGGGGQPHQQQYGTFQGGAPGYPQPAIGYPQPAPPPGLAPPTYPPPYSTGPPYYSHGYQFVPGYATIAEGRPLIMPRLPCCGIGIGWFLFVVGFFLAAIPWYVGAFILLCVRIDYREKPGLIACTIAAILAAIAVLLGATKGTDVW
ncbi:large ribosomal subunit protein eL20z [Elaeis guineensis]|uniref:60S ribosomal protein L18a-like protein n=1 Tax=Elaeis guineensis var. tenera TaxID=51953 RepID=A0A6I9R1P4_ELAGV|nr:60S ribosomal protein L18a-like protein [Elaeis guineensis]